MKFNILTSPDGTVGFCSMANGAHKKHLKIPPVAYTQSTWPPPFPSFPPKWFQTDCFGCSLFINCGVGSSRMSMPKACSGPEPSASFRDSIAGNPACTSPTAEEYARFLQSVNTKDGTGPCDYERVFRAHNTLARFYAMAGPRFADNLNPTVGFLVLITAHLPTTTINNQKFVLSRFLLSCVFPFLFFRIHGLRVYCVHSFARRCSFAEMVWPPTSGRPVCLWRKPRM